MKAQDNSRKTVEQSSTLKNLSRSERRKAMPKTTETVDAFRAVFGEPVAIAAEEANHRIVWGAW